jgi:uncharacterized RDD family membrane protein YckC
MATGDVDPSAATLAAASEDAGIAARTLTEGGARVAAVPSDDLIHKHLAHFRIEKRLGKGGMGEVYLATDLALERPVALKVLAPAIAADPQSRARFIREARAQARLIHPNICHIYFIGEQEGRLFFAMEYVDGENLQERLDRHAKIAVGDAVELCRMAAEGLAEAKRHGFTHRDIKPSNLLVDRHGVVKVADFGLVKDAARADVGETGQAGQILGTPLYMAPEQARGDPVDHRADIYALGVTLHHLVAGAPPFAGPTPLAVVSKHLSEKRPRLTQQVLVDALCERLMAKRPDDRPADYDEVVRSLEELSPRVTRPAGFWVRAGALCLDLIVAFAVGGVIDALLHVLRGFFTPVLIAAYFIYQHARFGQTLGKRALEIELVPVRGPRAARGVGWRRAAVRWLVAFAASYAASALDKIFDAPPWVVMPLMFVPPILMGLLAVRNPDRRALWDKVAGTRVVYKRR